MKLNTENVVSIFRDCLLSDDDPRKAELEGVTSLEDLPDFLVPAEGIQLKTGMVREKIEAHRDEIRSMLEALPSSFHANEGGGMSFLNMCEDQEGDQWTGSHEVVEQLLVLGIAAGFVSYPMPREMWQILPGAVPYVVVTF